MADDGIPLISPIVQKVQNFGAWYEEKKKAQHVGVRMALAAVPGAVQGGVLGSVTHYLTKMSASPSAMAKMSPEQRATLEQTANKTLPQTVKPLIALFVVQSALTEAVSHYRKGKDDMWQMCGSHGSSGCVCHGMCSLSHGVCTALPLLLGSVLIGCHKPKSL